MRGIIVTIVLSVLAASSLGQSACSRPRGLGASITVDRVVQEATSPQITVLTTLQASNRAKISLPRDVRVAKALVSVGDNVVRGDTLFTIATESLTQEREQLAAEHDEAAAQLEQAQYLLDNRDALLAQEQMTRVQYNGVAGEHLAITTRLKRLKADMAALTRTITNASVTSPMDGLVIRRSATSGLRVPANQAIVEIVDADPVMAAFQLTADEAGSIQVGDTIAVRIEDLPGKTFPAVVRFISPELQLSDRTFTVWGAIANPHGQLKVGMQGFAEFRTNRIHHVFRVPSSAIFMQERRPTVVVIDRGVARFHQVSIKAVEDDEAVLSSGVQAKDLIVIKGHEGLHDGMIVDIR